MIKIPDSLLIVDDDMDTCQNLADIFLDLDYRVATAYDGGAALEKLRLDSYDVALLDLMMPVMDGIQLCHEMKRRRPEIVAVLTTAYPNHPRIRDSLKNGIWRIVPKPIDVPRLLSLLREALDAPLVLLVDDDADLCASLRDLLGERGFRACVASNTQEASKLIRQRRFNVVLVDMQLPAGDGAEVFRLVRQVQPHALTVLISGDRSDATDSLDHLQYEGADAVCFKPFNLPELVAIIERLGRRSVPPG